MMGKRKCGYLVGKHGLGVRNERMIGLFIEEKDIIILITFFKLPPPRINQGLSQKTNLVGLFGTKLIISSFPKGSIIVV